MVLEMSTKTTRKPRFLMAHIGHHFLQRLSAILGSFADFTESRDEYGRLSHFRFIKSYISKSIAIFRESGIRILKKIIRMVALIFFIIASLFVFMIGYLKKHHEKWNDRKK